jgi:NAD+ synthase (glutamine-hydrolysing)
MKIALAQMNVIAGNPEKNVARMQEIIAGFAGTGALIAFPEMAVGGYLVNDLWYDEDYCDWLESFNPQLQAASREHEVTVVYGNIYKDRNGSRNKDGRTRKYNAAYIFDHGDAPAGSEHFVPGIQPKTLLPNYRFFDDERYFFSFADAALDLGVELEAMYAPFLLRNGLRVGLQLCEDLWCEDYRHKGRALNTARFLTRAGAQLLVNISASPWTRGKNAARDRRVKFITGESENPVPLFYVNRTGAENCGDNVITYDGGTTVYNHDGDAVYLANNLFNEEVVTVEGSLDGAQFKLELTEKKERVVEPISAQKLRAIIAGLRHVEQIMGNPKQKFIIGLSGGVDSCVVTCLLERAFGAERVTAVTMPSRHTSAQTLGNVQHLAEALGVKLLTVPIEECVQAWRRTVEPLLLEEIPPATLQLATENEQARVRGSTVLSGLAARLGAVYTNNGNKLETALGYATLYGDVNGVIAPLADLAKTEVVALARYLNEEVYRKEVVPNNLLPDDHWRFPQDGVQPSAELRDNQVDPMKFGYHDALLQAFTAFKRGTPEQMLRGFLDGSLHTKLGIPVTLMQRWGVDDARNFVDDLEWFATLLRRSVFKRVQAPPIIITSPSAFGYDIREAMVAPPPSETYRKLREQVLALGKYPGALTANE